MDKILIKINEIMYDENSLDIKKLDLMSQSLLNDYDTLDDCWVAYPRTFTKNKRMVSKKINCILACLRICKNIKRLNVDFHYYVDNEKIVVELKDLKNDICYINSRFDCNLVSNTNIYYYNFMCSVSTYFLNNKPLSYIVEKFNLVEFIKFYTNYTLNSQNINKIIFNVINKQ